MTIRNLDRLFSPASVSIVGASSKTNSLGGVLFRNAMSGGFNGPVWPVNPNYGDIGGTRCYTDAAALPGPPDLVVVATPAATVPQVIGDFAARGTRAAVVISAGLGRGPGSLQQQALDAGHPHLLRIVGANTLGILLPKIGLNASFSHAPALAGKLALLSQSGAVITTMIDWANDRKIGFSGIVSLGDMADVDFGDLLDWYATDGGTQAVLLYVEAITNPRKFVSAARAASRVKPVVVIKSGRHQQSAKAAASHTGALAGDNEVYDAVFRRCGLLSVDRLEDLFTATESVARMHGLRGRRLMVLTNGGGPGVLAIDSLVELGGQVAEISPETMQQLSSVLPDAWSKANPADIIGDAGPERYTAAIEALLSDSSSDALLVMNCPTAMASPDDTAKVVAGIIAEKRKVHALHKPVLTCWLGGETAERARNHFEDAGVAAYDTPHAAVSGFMQMVRFAEAQAAMLRVPESLPKDFAPDKNKARAIALKALERNDEWLSAIEIADILQCYQIACGRPRLARDEQEAGTFSKVMIAEHGTIAIKIASPDIQHKSDVGGVKLGIADTVSAAAATRDILASAKSARPDARLTGVTLEPMIRRPGARELIAGVTDDRLFGPVILFGHGGTAVEVIRDKVLALPPLDLALAHDLINQTQVARLLKPYRSEPGADIDAVALTLVKLSQLAADIPEIRDIDLNPLLADQDGVFAVDARIRIKPETMRDLNPRFSIRPYPSDWERHIALRDGARFRLRPVRPEDAGLYPGFFERITDDDLHSRFFTHAPDLSQSFFARMTQIDYARAMAFLALVSATGELAGVVRIHADPDHRQAEFAILIRSDLKGRGLGWQLMQLMIDYAKADGIGTIFGDVLTSNTTMLGMCRELGFTVVPVPDDPSLSRVTIDTRAQSV